MVPCSRPMRHPHAQSLSPVGQLLRDWRAARGMSQLDLAMQSGFSTRHVSFIETGRTQPSRQALLVLAETLEVPLRERNRLLEAGGYAHVYPPDAARRRRDEPHPRRAAVHPRSARAVRGGRPRSLLELPDGQRACPGGCSPRWSIRRCSTEHANYLRADLSPARRPPLHRQLGRSRAASARAGRAGAGSPEERRGGGGAAGGDPRIRGTGSTSVGGARSPPPICCCPIHIR